MTQITLLYSASKCGAIAEESTKCDTRTAPMRRSGSSSMPLPCKSSQNVLLSNIVEHVSSRYEFTIFCMMIILHNHSPTIPVNGMRTTCQWNSIHQSPSWCSVGRVYYRMYLDEKGHVHNQRSHHTKHQAKYSICNC